MMPRPPAIAVSSDLHHGVAVYAEQLGSEITGLAGEDVVVPLERLLEGGSAGVPPRVHVHFTDRLWAASPEAAADRFEDLAGRTRLTVTLHDLPQPSDGERNLRRRRDCYARVVSASAGVVVNSRHEAALLAEHTMPTATSAPVAVIPLPVTPRETAVPCPAPDLQVAVLGFFYPGKGHVEVVDALTTLQSGSEEDSTTPGLVVLGRPSPGHEAELDALVADAAARGIAVEVTGWLDDDAMLDRCRRVAVPAATHRHVSASGSIATWIAAGRRPLVPTTRYSTEMATLRPGTLTLVDEDDADALAAAIAGALADPASTWISDDAVTRPDLRDTATAYLDWFAATAPAPAATPAPAPGATP